MNNDLVSDIVTAFGIDKRSIKILQFAEKIEKRFMPQPTILTEAFSVRWKFSGNALLEIGFQSDETSITEINGPSIVTYTQSCRDPVVAVDSFLDRNRGRWATALPNMPIDVLVDGESDGYRRFGVARYMKGEWWEMRPHGERVLWTVDRWKEIV